MPSSSMFRFLQAPAAATRLRAAREFVSTLAPDREALIVGASRGAADDFVRDVARGRGATFGLHRFSLTELAARLAAPDLTARGLGATTDLGIEAVAARTAFDARRRGTIPYFSPVSGLPGFPRALARTLLQLRMAGVDTDALRALTRTGPDLAELLEGFEEQFQLAGVADRAELFRAAARALDRPDETLGGLNVLFLDVPLESRAEQGLARALAGSASDVFATVPWGDDATTDALKKLGALEIESFDDDSASTLARLRTFLFNETEPPASDPPSDVRVFSAPGEGRESVEVARRVMAEAHDGVAFDRQAILLRAPHTYVGLLEHALARAGVPAYFERGTRRPDPSGRAFLALLACRSAGLSAARFAEYLSLGQVPAVAEDGGPPRERAAWVPPADEAVAPRQLDLFAPAAPGTVQESGAPVGGSSPGADADREEEPEDDPDAPVVAGTLRAPWKWEQLIVEAAVVGGEARWRRRLDGLAAQYRVQLREVESEEGESPRAEAINRDLQALKRLRRFSLPVIETMARWPATATWGEWLAELEAFAPQVLRRPERVLEVLADLRPLAQVGPVDFDEVQQVLLERLTTLERRRPDRRHGRVFVGTPAQARGREFDVVFIPGLAERVFPQKPREDPMLLDAPRRTLDEALPNQEDRAHAERLLLRLAVGAARRRVHVSYPRLDLGELRSRVPSFYALDVVRAVTGRIPSHDEIQAHATREANASLAWPAPADPRQALDDVEYDLAVLRQLLSAPDRGAVAGGARHILNLNDFLQKSVRERWGRWKRSWTPYDGLRAPTERTTTALSRERLGARPYSLSALQRYGTCPYQFLLSAIYRLEARQEPEPLQRLDPLTRGSIFHQVQAEFFRALDQSGGTRLTPATLDRALAVLNRVLDRVARSAYDDLAPAIDRVWNDEITAIRTDLRAWVRQLADDPGGWTPELFEFGFGLPRSEERDPRSHPDPITIEGRFHLRGSVDLVERREGSRELRVTDHKTGRDRYQPGQIVGGGTSLQPVLYSLVVERALGDPVVEGRFSYCTTAGGFAVHAIPIDERARRLAIETLEIVDRGVEHAVLLPAPSPGACKWCDFRPVCGPDEERRLGRKPTSSLEDLAALRKLP
jgi:CRISPR/Cas system-associated exonuclease Cas4 (RecB family)